MSGRWSDDDGDRYDDDTRPNAQCGDCGADYSKALDDPTTTCDPCSDRRDAHTSALERRMAKADLPSTPDQRIA